MKFLTKAALLIMGIAVGLSLATPIGLSFIIGGVCAFIMIAALFQFCEWLLRGDDQCQKVKTEKEEQEEQGAALVGASQTAEETGVEELSLPGLENSN
jgi:hypothetical protein